MPSQPVLISRTRFDTSATMRVSLEALACVSLTSMYSYSERRFSAIFPGQLLRVVGEAALQAVADRIEQSSGLGVLGDEGIEPRLCWIAS